MKIARIAVAAIFLAPLAVWASIVCPTGYVQNQNLACVPQKFTVTITPPVGGKITAPGINCPGTCSADFDFGSTVILAAAPVAFPHPFGQWSGACVGQGNPCQLVISGAVAISATFQLIARPYTGGGLSDGIRVAIQSNSGEFLQADSTCVDKGMPSAPPNRGYQNARFGAFTRSAVWVIHPSVDPPGLLNLQNLASGKFLFTDYDDLPDGYVWVGRDTGTGFAIGTNRLSRWGKARPYNLTDPTRYVMQSCMEPQQATAPQPASGCRILICKNVLDFDPSVYSVFIVDPSF